MSRILLKISGEAFSGKEKAGIDASSLKSLSTRLLELQKRGHQLALVVGGGNIFRGLQYEEQFKGEFSFPRVAADQMGMLATLINGIALKQALVAQGCKATVMSAIACDTFVETYSWERSLALLEDGEIVIFVGGTSHPYFTTDSAAALRASEIRVDILLKATCYVDGVYNKDPRTHRDAVKFEELTYKEVLEKKLNVMDLTAIALCMVNKIPIKVFNLSFSFEDALHFEKKIGTLVRGE